MTSRDLTQRNLKSVQEIDERLSKRFINLDPCGYFLISIQESSREIIVERFSNDLDELGRAIDPETGKPISCKGGEKRIPLNTYSGRSAKEIGIQLTEREGSLPISCLDHALYMGRELQKAEECLKSGSKYIQD